MRTDRSPHRHSSIVAVAVVTVFLLVAGACSKSGDSSSNNATDANAVQAQDTALQDEGTPQTGGTVVMAVTAETNGWNPALAQWADAGNFVGSSFLEPLFVYNTAGDVVPWLAESAEPDNDYAQNWTIHLRKGISSRTVPR